MQRRHEAYNQQLDYLLEQEKAGNTMLIFPEKELKIGRTELNEEKMRTVYGQGIEQGKATIDCVKDFIIHP